MIINPYFISKINCKRWDDYVIEKQKKKLHWIK
jgi:hypothetical protein